MKREAPDPIEAKQFQEAVAHRLSGLREDPFLAKRIIANEEKERKMKKKASIGLILALSLILVFSAALTENWQTVTEFFSTVGSHPDLETNEPGRKDAAQGDKTITRHVIERVFAPVTVTVLNEAGEEAESFQLDAQVAQVEYLYTLTYSQANDTWTDTPNMKSRLLPPPRLPSGRTYPLPPIFLRRAGSLK